MISRWNLTKQGNREIWPAVALKSVYSKYQFTCFCCILVHIFAMSVCNGKRQTAILKDYVSLCLLKFKCQQVFIHAFVICHPKWPTQTDKGKKNFIKVLVKMLTFGWIYIRCKKLEIILWSVRVSSLSK